MSIHLQNITEEVCAAMAQSPNPRLAQITQSLVKHLHAFVREVRPSEEEFERGCEFLVHLGQASNAKKNEVILASDILGASTLITLLNNPESAGKTDTALLGPFWRAGAPQCELGDDIARQTHSGELPLWVRGQVCQSSGHPIAGATVDVWQASPKGLYENQDAAQPSMNLRGMFKTDAQGNYYFKSVRPAGYPVPVDGPCGDLLRAQNRHPYRPAHLHFMVSAPGYRVLTTQVFADDDERLETDVTFSVIQSLKGHYQLHEADSSHNTSWYSLDFDFVLHPGPTRFPTPPIP
jgi:catechol 1,2-dioxygenase